MKKTLIIAAAAASLFIAGCATDGSDASSGTKGNFTSGNSCHKTPAAQCKGMAQCKGKSACKTGSGCKSGGSCNGKS